MVRKVKMWFASINEESWHYRLVQFTKVDVPKKACSYYWVCVPTALAVASIVGALFCLIVGIGWFIGFVVNTDSPKLESYGYKTRKDGSKKFVAPWEIVTPTALVWEAIRVAPWVYVHRAGFYVGTGIVVAALAALGAAVAIPHYGRKGIRAYQAMRSRDQLQHDSGTPRESVVVAAFKKAWDKACPDLIVKKE